MRKEKEIRTYKNYEIRATETEDGKRTITAVIPYNSQSEDLGFIEILKPGCFHKTINDGYNVRALYQHNDASIIGSVKNGTLNLIDTEASLTAEITLPDTTEARDIYNLVRDGYITNCSFGFRSIKDDWNTTEDGKQIRTIIEAQLFEISPVTFPAYEMTSVSASLRSLSEFNIDSDALIEAVEARDKERIKAILSPLYTDEAAQDQTGAVEETAAESTVDPTLYEYDLDALLM